MSLKEKTIRFRPLIVICSVLVVVLLASTGSSWVGSAAAQTVPTAAPDETPLVPTVTPEPPVSLLPEPEGEIAVVTQESRCRSGPGESYEVMGTIVLGDSVIVIGRGAKGRYLFIWNPDQPGEFCWVTAEHLILEVGIEELPVITTPPMADCETNFCDSLKSILRLAIIILILLIINTILLIRLLLRTRRRKGVPTEDGQTQENGQSPFNLG